MIRKRSQPIGTVYVAVVDDQITMHEVAVTPGVETIIPLGSQLSSGETKIKIRFAPSNIMGDESTQLSLEDALETINDALICGELQLIVSAKVNGPPNSESEWDDAHW